MAELTTNNQLLTFESFGGYEERRACIAERDGDDTGAIYYWTTLDSTNLETQKRRDEALVRIFQRVISNPSVMTVKATIEALIERIRKRFEDPQQYVSLLNAYGRVESALVIALGTSDSDSSASLLFRLRNFMMVIANHRADMQLAVRLNNVQATSAQKLGMSPEFFDWVLDYKLQEMEMCINRLDFLCGLQMAREYHSLVQAYKICWGLLVGESNIEAFDRSRIFIRAEMTLARCLIYSAPLGDSDELREAIGRLERLESNIGNFNDRKRLNNYLVMAFLHKQQFQHALDLALTALRVDPTPFDYYWAGRAAADTVLFSRLDDEKPREVLNILRKLSVSKGHPFDLIWRERGLLELLVGNGIGESLKCYKNSRLAANVLSSESPLVRWLHSVLDLHVDWAKGVYAPGERYFGNLPEAIPITKIAVFCPASTDYFLAIRSASPY